MYKIINDKNNRWGEGWKAGDIVAMDKDSARVPLLNGEIEEVDDIVIEEYKEPVIQEKIVCDVCGKECKSDFGLKTHKRSHK